MCEESKQHVVHFKLMMLAVHPNHQVDVLVAAFVKDLHIQRTYYATLVAIVSYIQYTTNIIYHDHRHVTLS